MTEVNFWHTVRENLGPYGRLVRIENKCDVGTPDVHYTLRGRSGWIELKSVRKGPVRADTPLRIDHLTKEQITWMGEENKAGGRAWLLMQIGRIYILTNNLTHAWGIHDRKITMNDLMAEADVYRFCSFPTKEIVKCLIN